MNRHQKKTDKKKTGNRNALTNIGAAIVIGASLLASGCGNPVWLPPAHKIELQQGNLLTQEQIDSIKTGMQREDVKALIGVPVSTSTFQQDRWNYTFTRGPVGSVIKPRRFTVIFDGETVASTDDNFQDETGQRVIRKTWWQRLFPTET